MKNDTGFVAKSLKECSVGELIITDAKSIKICAIVCDEMHGYTEVINISSYINGCWSVDENSFHRCNISSRNNAISFLDNWSINADPVDISLSGAVKAGNLIQKNEKLYLVCGNNSSYGNYLYFDLLSKKFETIGIEGFVSSEKWKINTIFLDERRTLISIGYEVQ